MRGWHPTLDRSPSRSLSFFVVEAEPAIAVRFAEWIHPAEPVAAPLVSAGWSLHDSLHTVEGGVLVKYTLGSLFLCEIERTRSLLQNFGLGQCETADKFWLGRRL